MGGSSALVRSIVLVEFFLFRVEKPALAVGYPFSIYVRGNGGLVEEEGEDSCAELRLFPHRQNLFSSMKLPSY